MAISNISKTMLFVTAALLGCHGKLNAELNKEEAIRLATTRLEKEKNGSSEGLSLERVSYETKPYNWRYPESDKSDYAIRFRKSVQGKHYWIVYWAPTNKLTAGGDIAIILDAADGAVLNVYRGK